MHSYSVGTASTVGQKYRSSLEEENLVILLRCDACLERDLEAIVSGVPLWQSIL